MNGRNERTNGRIRGIPLGKALKSPEAAIYREYPPCQALAPYVECYWTSVSAGAVSGEHRVLPDGCIDVLFESADGRTFRGEVVGTMSQAFVVPQGASLSYCAVRFRPGMAPAFLGGIPAHELTDLAAPIADLSLEGFADIREHLSVARLEKELLRLLPRAERLVDPYVRAIAAHVVRERGRVKVASLSDLAGVSRQHLARRFRAHVGVSTKEFARIMRFRALVDEARAGVPDWAGLAVDLGFYDQAHLISEFRAFSGLSPGSFFPRP